MALKNRSRDTLGTALAWAIRQTRQPETRHWATCHHVDATAEISKCFTCNLKTTGSVIRTTMCSHCRIPMTSKLMRSPRRTVSSRYSNPLARNQTLSSTSRLNSRVVRMKKKSTHRGQILRWQCHRTSLGHNHRRTKPFTRLRVKKHLRWRLSHLRQSWWVVSWQQAPLERSHRPWY